MHHRLVVLLVAALALAVACRKQAPTESPATDGAGAQTRADALDELELELERLRAQLAGGDAAKLEVGNDATMAADTTDRCARTCQLSEAICGVKDKICGLAGEHEDEPRYADACARATEDCREATEACDGCTP